jgi:uncharacterized protein YmfQ (DUF2313 family)
MDLLPGYYYGNRTMEELQEIISGEIVNASDALDKIISECFASTTTDIISRYEKIHGIKVDISKSIDTRRGKVKAKMAGTGTFTKAMLMNTTRAFLGGSCEVVEDNPNAHFTIKFNDYYRVPDTSSINEIHAITDELKPAHLAYNHTFTYNWWGMPDTGTWDDGGTWDDLRNYTEV